MVINLDTIFAGDRSLLGRLFRIVIPVNLSGIIKRDHDGHRFAVGCAPLPKQDISSPKMFLLF